MKKRKKSEKLEEIILQGLMEYPELSTRELFWFVKRTLQDRSFGYTIGTISAVLTKLKKLDKVVEVSKYPACWSLK